MLKFKTRLLSVMMIFLAIILFGCDWGLFEEEMREGLAHMEVPGVVESYYEAIEQEDMNLLEETLHPDENIEISFTGEFYGNYYEDTHYDISREDYVKSFSEEFLSAYKARSIELQNTNYEIEDNWAQFSAEITEELEIRAESQNFARTESDAGYIGYDDSDEDEEKEIIIQKYRARIELEIHEESWFIVSISRIEEEED